MAELLETPTDDTSADTFDAPTATTRPEWSPADTSDIDGLDRLIDRMAAAETVRDWSFILADYLSFGNSKLNDNIAIFNIGAARECVNLATDRCQVNADECYALKSENIFPGVQAYRRRQAYLWDALDAETFADAFLLVVERKHNDVDMLRFNQSGDFRHRGDLIRADRVAERLADHGVATYTYTASSFLDTSRADHLVVNASNPHVAGANQQYIVVADESEIPDDAFVCPASDDTLTCGECLACMVPGGSDEIYELLRT